MLSSLFRSRRVAPSQTRRQARRHRALGGWETLGGVASGLAEIESLESRIALAADLVTQFVEPAAYYVPGSPARYVVTVFNPDSDVTDVAFSTSLASQFTSRTWTAVYSGGASGPRSGSGDVNAEGIDIPLDGEVRFTIDGVFAPLATGNATSSATATVSGEIDTLGENTATNTREQAAQAIAVSDDLSRTGGATVRVVDAASGTELNRFRAYAGSVRGVQTVMADMDNDGRPDIVTAPLRGGSGEIRVFTAAGLELEKYRLTPFGSSWSGGLSVAVGDFDGDELLDIAAAKASGDGEIRVFRGTGDAIAPLEATPWLTIRPFASTFLGGASIAAADMGTFSSGTIVDAGKQDGRAELIVANGPSVAPVVRVYDMSGATPHVIDTIRPFSPGFFGGVSVATGRVNVDGIPDLILSAGRRGNSATEVYDGRVGSGANAKLASFAAFATLGRSPAATTATAIDTDGDGRINTIYSSQGSGGRGSLTELDPSGAFVTRLESFTGPIRAAAPAVVGDRTLVTTASGLQFREIQAGTGAFGAVGKLNEVDYTGTLLDGGIFSNLATAVAGAQFDSSRDPEREPFVFRGNGRVTRVFIDNGGSGYTSPPTVTFSAPSAGGVRAEGIAVLGTGPDAGKVVDVTITKEGSGYTNEIPAMVTFSAPASGTRAVGYSQIDRVIEGWNEALPLMRVGGRYQFIIPAALAYGSRETLPSPGRSGIPANSTLVFDIELLSST